MGIGSLVSPLFSSKRRIALVATVALVAAIGGAVAVGVFGVPGVAGIDNTFGGVTEETTVVETDLVVSNPNPIGVGADGVAVNYTVSMNSIGMARGNRTGITIGTGNSTLDLETEIRNDAIPPWWTSHIRNDERTTIEVDATVTSSRLGRSAGLSRSHGIETDLIGAFNSEETRPVNADSPLTDDPVLYVNETRSEWGAVSESETPIEMEFDLYNPNLEPYVVTRLGYTIAMNGVELGKGETRDEHVIGPYSTETVPLTTTIRNERLDEWWVTHLDEGTYGHQVSELRIEFHAIVELPTGEEIAVPLEELTYEETVTTDIFDEGGDVGDPTSENGTADTDEADGESTPDEGQDSEGDAGTDDGGTESDSGHTDKNGTSTDGERDGESTDSDGTETDNESTDGGGTGTDGETDDGDLLPV